MELRRYATLLRRRYRLIVISTFAAAVLGFLISTFMLTVYEASTTLLVNQAQTPGTVAYNDILTNQQLTKTYSELITKRPVLENAISNLKLPISPEKLGERLNVQVVRDTTLLVVKAQSTDPQQAANMANAVAQSFIEENRKAQLGQAATSRSSLQAQLDSIDRDIKTTSARIDQLRLPSDGPTADASQAEIARLQTALSQYQLTFSQLLKSEEDMRIAEAKAYNSVVVAEPAAVPTIPISPKKTQNVLLGALLGLMLAIGATLLVEYLDDTVKSSEDVANALGVPALGHVALLGPQDAEMLRSRREKGLHLAAIDSFRALNTNLQFSTLDRPAKSILLTSAGPSEGKTLIAINLARVIAQTGKRVILVDADLRKPSIHQCLRLTNNQGLTTALPDLASHARGALQPSGLWNLTVMTSGPVPPDPSRLLASPRMSELVKSLTEKADVVLLDSPPLLSVSDPIILAASVDAMLLVVDSSRTRAATLVRVREMLEYAVGSGRLLGAVLNKLKPASENYRYRYYYHEPVDSGDRREQVAGEKSRQTEQYGHDSAQGKPANEPNPVTS